MNFDHEIQRALVREANLAPSVHNVQPTRFRFESDGSITLFEDLRRRLIVGDPKGADGAKSVGAAAEGMIIALSARGLNARVDMLSAEEPSGPLVPRVRIVPGGHATEDPLRAHVETRISWRGAFAEHSPTPPPRLPADSVILRSGDAELTALAQAFDAASMAVLRVPPYRAELLSWMRLSTSHPSFSVDGLNAPAMALTPPEAFAAGLVLGPLFAALDAIGLATLLISEGAKLRSAAGVALFHRPAEEPEVETGRHFYRVWLELSAAGYHACPMSVLADHAPTARTLLPDASRKLVTGFRYGKLPPGKTSSPRTRLPVEALLV